MPVDPVCGIEMDESLALIHEHNGEKYYFCCNGCKKIFIKKPKKYLNYSKLKTKKLLKLRMAIIVSPEKRICEESAQN